MTTVAATRNAELAVIECLGEDGCVIGHYDGNDLVAFIPVSCPVSLESIVAALPGVGWAENAECGEWLQWAMSQA